VGAHRRQTPQHLPAKLLAIRNAFGASQTQMARALNFHQSTFQVNAARVCEYEGGSREPNLITLLAYSRVARVSVEKLIDDQTDLTQFQDILAKKTRFVERFVTRSPR
jgi:transcriptional regulator with XRE-family HTH domain